jgi:hypothetical protein
LIERYLDELARELGSVGIRGAQRRRILAEAEDHLRESGEPERFGEPAVVAARFADELATSGARRVAWGSVVALAPAGIAYAILLSLPAPWPDITAGRSVPIALAAAAMMLLAPQISFAAGLLAVAGAWRLRSEVAAPAQAITLLRRRAGVALAAGATALLAVMVTTYEFSAWISTWRVALTFSLAGVCLLPIAAGAVALRRTGALRPQAAGDAGDVFDDLAPVLDRLPLDLRGRPWRLCLLFAAAVAALALLGGGVLNEGPRNAIAEFAAVCAGFAVLGRYLGLRPSRARH